jgi:hypothetical protein
MKNKKNIRLSPYIKPNKYELTLKPDLESFVFSGNEIIYIIIKKEIKSITMHSKDIDIETVKIKDQFANKINYNTKEEIDSFIEVLKSI